MRRYLMLFMFGFVAFLPLGFVVAANAGAITPVVIGTAALGGFTFGTGLVIIEAFFEKSITGSIKGVIGPRQTRLLYIDMPYDEAFESCTTSLDSLRRFSIKEANMENGNIKAETGFSWRSFGESVTFRLEHTDRAGTSVTLSSRPLWATALVDHGKSYQNLENIIKSLKSRSEVQVITP